MPAYSCSYTQSHVYTRTQPDVRTTPHAQSSQQRSQTLTRQDLWRGRGTAQLYLTSAALPRRNAWRGRIQMHSSLRKPKNFQNSPSYRILYHMHEILNIDENKN